MKMMSRSRALVAVAVLAGTAAFFATPVLAQTPPGPPVCGSVASLMNLHIFLEGPGAIGDNIVSFPASSPVNNNPSSANNGFRQICNRFGLGTTTSSLLQFNAQAGTIATFTCDQPSPPTWTPGQAAIVRPVAVATPISGRVPGVECSRPYTAYGEGPGAQGDNLYPVPVTITSNSPQDLCTQLGLPTSSQVIQFVAGTLDPPSAPAAQINTHLCGGVATFSLRIGEGVLIRPTGTAGAAVATGSPVIF